MVMSMGREFGPICMVPVMCILVWVVLGSVQVDSTVPVAVIWPVQATVADMPSGLMEMFVVWQSPRWGLEYGPPYLSIMAWVMQTWVVCGPPIPPPGGSCTPGGNCGIWGIWGMPAMVMVLVVSQRPGFCLDWAFAAKAMRQQPRAIQTRVWRIFPPDDCGQWPRAFTLMQGGWGGEGKSIPRAEQRRFVPAPAGGS